MARRQATTMPCDTRKDEPRKHLRVYLDWSAQGWLSGGGDI